MVGDENKATRPKYIVCLVDNTQPLTKPEIRSIPTEKDNLLSPECQFSIRRTEIPSTIHHSSCHLVKLEEGPGTQHVLQKTKEMTLASHRVRFNRLPVDHITVFTYTNNVKSRTATISNRSRIVCGSDFCNRTAAVGSFIRYPESLPLCALLPRISLLWCQVL